MINSDETNGANGYRWVILALTVACFLFTFIIRLSWPPLIPVVVPVLGMKMSQAGAFMSAFYIGYVITQIPAGILADRFGVRIILALSLIIEGVATFGMGFIHSYDMGFWLRVLTGLGAGAVFGSCSRAIMEWFPAKERGTAFGIMLAAPSAAIVLSNFIAPFLNSLVGWRGTFETIGFVTIIFGVLIFIFVRSTTGNSDSKSVLSGLKIIFGSKDLLLTALAGFCLMWVELGTATWANTYIKQLGYTVAQAGLVMIFYGIGGIIAPMLTGYLSDRMKNRKSLIILSFSLVIPLTIIFGYQTSLQMLSLVGFFFGFASYIANPQLTTLISEFAGKEWAGTANGTANFIFQLAPMIGPIVLGLSIDVTGSFASVWWIMAAGPLIGLFLLIPVNERRKRA